MKKYNRSSVHIKNSSTE